MDEVIVLSKVTKAMFEDLKESHKLITDNYYPRAEPLDHIRYGIMRDGKLVAYAKLLLRFDDCDCDIVFHNRVDVLLAIPGSKLGGKVLQHIIDTTTGELRLRACYFTPWLIDYYKKFGFVEYGHGWPEEELVLRR